MKRFKPRARITRSADFQLCQKEGKRYTGKRVVLLKRKTGEPGNRLGVVVTRKTGTAVMRNRWKRIIRELFRENQDRLTPGDHVVIVRRSTRGAPMPEDRAEVLRLFERAAKA